MIKLKAASYTRNKRLIFTGTVEVVGCCQRHCSMFVIPYAEYIIYCSHPMLQLIKCVLIVNLKHHLEKQPHYLVGFSD